MLFALVCSYRVGCDCSGRSATGSACPDEAPRITATVNDFVVSDLGQGWSSLSYVSSRRAFLTVFVNYYGSGGYHSNAMRAFDPTTGDVTELNPTDVPGAPADRSDHEMVYNPARDQLWVHFGNSHVIFDVPTGYANLGVAPSYAAVGWSTELDNAQFATTASIANWPTDFQKYDAVVAWHATRDIGVIWSGMYDTNQGVSNDLYLIKPNPQGPERYTLVQAGNFDDQLAPPGYVKFYIYNTTFRGRHNGRILGDYFYTLSIDDTKSLTDLGGGDYTNKIDLLRFDLDAGAMTRMAPLTFPFHIASGHAPPDAWEGMDFPCVTADTRLNLLLVYLSSRPPHNLWAYLVDLDRWVEVEGAAPYRRLAACDYSPDHGVHAYLDGQTDRTSYGWGTVSLQRVP
jgi:hypothetical protein